MRNILLPIILTGILCSLTGCLSSSSEPKQVFPPDSYDLADYTQVFFDDFNGTKLDETKWSRCPQWQRQDHGGYWSDECSYVKDGNLVLEARNNNGRLESGAIRSRYDFDEGANSGKIKFGQEFGAYQIRFKAEKRSGLWSAFWLMYANRPDEDGTAKYDGEIDIFEIIPNDQGKMYMNSATHWDGYGSYHQQRNARHYIDNSFYGKWHTVTFFWGAEKYKAFLDDEKEPFLDVYVDAFGEPALGDHYMKITSEFGKWAGAVDPTLSTKPSYFLVDWVKAYQRKPETLE